jgi:peptidoglycan/xylan/chitin deacetylase (PgdA/CDA1 family)
VSPVALLAAAVIALAHSPGLSQARVVSGPHDAPIPILMYHVVTAPPPGAAYPELWVPWPSFVQQMLALKRAGYHGITLGQAWDYWHKGIAVPPKPVVISFDDGYLSQYRTALPVLRAHHWPGVLNLELRNTEPVWGTRPGEVRAMIRAGWEIDSHTLTHPDLTTLDATRLREEVAGSRAELRRRFGVPANFFCYPSGRFDDAVVAAVKQAGYLGATTTSYGLARPQDLYTLARVRVDGGAGARGLAAQLESFGLP